MNVWEFLGISPTMDVKVIKRAYAKKLRGAHPEDDIAAFQTLQEAYQAALKEAQYLLTVAVDDDNESRDSTNNTDNTNMNLESAESELSTVQEDSGEHFEWSLSRQAQDELLYSTHIEENNFPVWFIEQVDALYGDFNARTNPSNWTVLLVREELWAYEQWTTVSDLLWEYLHSHYHLPREIWRLLEQHFNWIDNKGSAKGIKNNEDEAFFEYYYHQVYKPWEFSYPSISAEINGDAFIALREEARRALTINDLDKAIYYLQEAQALYANDFDLLRLYGEYLWRTDHMQDAGLIYERLVREFPYEESVMLQYGSFLIGEQRINEALKLYQEILAENSDSIGAMTGIALCYRHYGQLQEAKGILELLIEQHPTLAVGDMMLSDLNIQIINEINHKLLVTPDSVQLKYELAQLYFETDQFEDCCTLLAQIEREGGVNSAIYLLWGRAKFSQEQYERSQELLTTAKQLVEQEGINGYEIKVALGRVLYYLGLHEQAQLQLAVAVEMNPLDPYVNFLIGAVYYQQEQFESAIQYCTKAISLNSTNNMFYIDRARSYYALERWEEAIGDLEFILRENRFYGYGWFMKGYCHANLQQYELAAFNFQKSIDYLNGEFAYFNVAIAYVNLGEYSNALAALTQCKVHFNDVKLYILEGDIYRATGDFERAWETYSSGVEQNPQSYMLVQRAVYTYMRYIFPRNEEKVLDWLEAILNEHPWDRWMAIHMARILINSKMWKEVNILTSNLFYECEDNEYAKELSSFYSGVAYYHRGNADEAYFWLQYALSQERNPVYLIYNSMACLQLKKNKEALTYAEEAIEMVPDHTEYQQVYEIAKQANQGMMKKLLSKPLLSSLQLFSLTLIEVQGPGEVDAFYNVLWG